MNNKDNINENKTNSTKTINEERTNKKEEKKKNNKQKMKKPLMFNFSNKSTAKESLPSSEEKEFIDSNKEENSNQQVNEVSNSTDEFKINIEEENNSNLKNEENNSIINSSVEENKSLNNNNLNQQADFNSIFNVSSEENNSDNQNEKPETDTNQNQEPLKEDKKDSEENIAERKKVVFNGNERLLYEIKPDKQGNPLVVVLFFVFLFSVIVVLPYITKKIKFENKEPTTNNPVVEEDKGDFYLFNRTSVRVKIGGLEFTNFVKASRNGEYTLTFNITNTNDSAYLFDKKYYVVFYEGEKTVYRALIHSYDVIGANSAHELTLNINERAFSSADKFRIEEIPVSLYPDISITEKDGDYSVLTCTYRHDEIKYYFQDGMLVKLKETYTENNESSTKYQENKQAYKNLSNSYKNVRNFSSTFIEGNNYFTMINEFGHKDISDATLANLKTYKFFRYNETQNTEIGRAHV